MGPFALYREWRTLGQGALLRLPRPRERLTAAMDNINRQGVEVYGAVRLDWMSADSYYFYDPDGTLLEFRSPGVESRAPMPVQDS